MPLFPGEPGVNFKAPTPSIPEFTFDTAAGRYLVLCFVPEEDGAIAGLTGWLDRARPVFDDRKAAFFGVVRDPGQASTVRDEPVGIRWFLDLDRRISALYGLEQGSGWVILDPAFRVWGTAPFAAAEQVLAALVQAPAVDDHAGAQVHAPVLIAPRIFEPELCQRLIAAYDEGDSAPSGFMREVDGKTVLLTDPAHKKRSDHTLPHGPLRDEVRAKITRRLVPEIRKVFQFQVTRMERDLVACYDGAEGGFFRAHRDNTTKGTAHRRFAVTINLNAGDYEGGDLVFPEFGSRTYRAPTGGAVVFSCSLLHAAMPVTSGRRYAFLPFLYDDEAARLREANLAFVAPDLQHYRSGL